MEILIVIALFIVALAFISWILGTLFKSKTGQTMATGFNKLKPLGSMAVKTGDLSLKTIKTISAACDKFDDENAERRKEKIDTDVSIIEEILLSQEIVDRKKAKKMRMMLYKKYGKRMVDKLWKEVDSWMSKNTRRESGIGHGKNR